MRRLVRNAAPSQQAQTTIYPSIEEDSDSKLRDVVNSGGMRRMGTWDNRSVSLVDADIYSTTSKLAEGHARHIVLRIRLWSVEHVDSFMTSEDKCLLRFVRGQTQVIRLLVCASLSDGTGN